MDRILRLLSQLPDVLSRYSDNRMAMYVLSFSSACRRVFGGAGLLIGAIGPFGIVAIVLTIIRLRKYAQPPKEQPGLALPVTALFFSLIWLLFWVRPAFGMRYDSMMYFGLAMSLLLCLIHAAGLFFAIRKRNAPPKQETAPAAPETTLPPGVTMDDLRSVLERLDAEEKNKRQ